MRRLSWIALSLAYVACGDDDHAVTDGGMRDGSLLDAGLPTARLSLEELQDPATCAGCHPTQYAEWKSSMHAYASVDPVFLAMNKRGQRETDGGLGQFCVQCHAPMALHNKVSLNGLELDDPSKVPDKFQGVTCYYCHNVATVGSMHNNADLILGDDDQMRGPLKNAVDPGVHSVGYSEAHDPYQMQSSYLCGTCHDVVNQKNLHLERTLSEYENSVVSLASGNPGANSCQSCHMQITGTDYIATPPANLGLTLKKRSLHSHRMAAVDVALRDDFGDQSSRDAHEHATMCQLNTGAFVFAVEADAPQGLGHFSVQLETGAGHAWPSGTSQDRRMWLEVIAYDANDNVVWSNGVIGPQDVEGAGVPNPGQPLCLFRDYVEDENHDLVHMFWEPVAIRTTQSRAMPQQTDLNSNHTATCEYSGIPGWSQIARISARLMIRPVGMDVLQDLVASGDLDPAVKMSMPTFEVPNTHFEWRPAMGSTLSAPIASIPIPGLEDCTMSVSP